MGTKINGCCLVVTGGKECHCVDHSKPEQEVQENEGWHGGLMAAPHAGPFSHQVQQFLRFCLPTVQWHILESNHSHKGP